MSSLSPLAALDAAADVGSVPVESISPEYVDSSESALRSPPVFSAIDYSAAAPAAPSEPPISPLSGAPPRRSAIKRTAPLSDPPLQQAPSIFDGSMLSALELPDGCATRPIARASIDSAGSSVPSSRRRSSSTSSSSSRRSSLSSVTSTESDTTEAKKPRLRAIPRFCVAVVMVSVKETYSLLKDIKRGLFPPPTPEKMLTIPAIPMMRNTPRARAHLPAAFTGLAPGEKRTRFLCPARACIDPAMWPDLAEL